MLKTVLVLLIALISYSCLQQKSKGAPPQVTDLNQVVESSSGLKIETTPTRGTGLRDSLGSEYFIAHVTNTITNHHSIPIQLEIELPSEFSHSISDHEVKFQILLWPELTEPPQLYEDNQGRIRVMKNLIVSEWEATNQFNKLLAPGDSYVVTIGTLVNTGEPIICSAVAYSLLTYGERSNYADCAWALDEAHVTNPELALGLQVGFCTSGRHYESCMITTCGGITYVEN